MKQRWSKKNLLSVGLPFKTVYCMHKAVLYNDQVYFYIKFNQHRTPGSPLLAEKQSHTNIHLKKCQLCTFLKT